MIIMDGVGLRLREERDRLKVNQTEFGSMMGVSRSTQKAYELETGSPDLRYIAQLEEIGVDAYYVLSGFRTEHGLGKFSEEEKLLLQQYRVLPERDRQALQRFALAMATTVEGHTV